MGCRWWRLLLIWGTTRNLRQSCKILRLRFRTLWARPEFLQFLSLHFNAALAEIQIFWISNISLFPVSWISRRLTLKPFWGERKITLDPYSLETFLHSSHKWLPIKSRQSIKTRTYRIHRIKLLKSRLLCSSEEDSVYKLWETSNHLLCSIRSAIHRLNKFYKPKEWLLPRPPLRK
jgi:hypothetical protein